jgi:hypothetical protein
MRSPSILALILSAAASAPAVGQEGAIPPVTESAPVAEQAEVREHPLAAEAREVRAVMETLLADKKAKLKTSESKKARLRLHTDFKSSRNPKAAMKATEEILQAMLWGFGPYDAGEERVWQRDDHPIELYMIQDEDLYLRIIDELVVIAPRYKGFLESCRNGTGFTLYPARLAVYYHNVKIQAEARMDHSIAHNAAHLELHRRYGFTPLQLAEGVACAVEEIALGGIWANWYRDEFVFAVSHDGWRGAATKNVVMKLDLQELWNYPANPYDDARAHLAYGFTVFALDAKPAELQKMYRAIQALYDAHPEQGGLYKIEPATLAELAEKAFGPALQEEFRAYWAEKTPKSPKISRLRG